MPELPANDRERAGSSDPRGDAELLRAHAAGAPDAFRELFHRHRDRLWAVALRTMGDPDEAADALQDALLSAHRAAGRFRGESAVTTWLHRIVVNACLDRLRRRAARPTVPLADAGDSSDPRPVGGVEPVAPAVDHDTVLTVRAALQQLPDEQRVAIVLVDLQGYPVAEVAAMLGVAEGTVKSRCARGRARLAALLGHLPEQSPSGTGPRSAPAGNRNADGTVPFRSGGTTPKGGAR
ncbi:MAG TPA: RNA polymerase sigma factor SigM [Natronosporangium sp.]|jgi:RNA polymerase sigma-70 factor (ECF subfamily)|nr:RNA polymerase sigma factor SigM [Natronosporangium sp.]